MGKIEEHWRRGISRRRALAGLASLVAGTRLLRGQQDLNPLSTHQRALGLDEMETVWDFEAVYNANVPKALSDYTAHGDGTEWTLRRNRSAFEWVEIKPPVPGQTAVDPKTVDLSTEICGTPMKFPLMIAPTARHLELHPDGEAGSHRGATAAARTPYIVAYKPTVPLPRVAAAADGPMWYQLYGDSRPEANQEDLELAQSLGCRAIVVTVDQIASVYPRSLHDRNLRYAIFSKAGKSLNGMHKSFDRRAAKAGAVQYGVDPTRLWYNWEWLEAVRKYIHVPVLVKGILTADDARACAAHDVGIIVSNHGGRSLDYDPSTLEVLPEVVEAARGRVPVLMDSGIRRGSDIYKALALGADAVCVGRAERWGLGAFGAEGVQRVLEILQNELVQTAAAAGRATLNSIDATAVEARFT